MKWRTFRLSKLMLFAAATSGALMAQPFIFHGGVVNAASFAPSFSAIGPVAQGSIFTIFGRNLGPDQGSVVNAFPLGTTFQGVSVKVCQNEACLDAIPIFVVASQLNVILPSGTPLGWNAVQVTYNGDTSNFEPVRVVASSVGIFAVNGGGYGPGIVTNYVAADNQPVNSLRVTAKPGQAVTIWGTGLGAGLNADNVAPQTGDLPVNVQVTIGGKTAAKLYSGRSGCCSGLDQIVVTVPQDAPQGCYVPVRIQTPNGVSNTVTMAIQQDGTTCDDPHNPAPALLSSGARLDC